MALQVPLLPVQVSLPAVLVVQNIFAGLAACRPSDRSSDVTRAKADGWGLKQSCDDASKPHDVPRPGDVQGSPYLASFALALAAEHCTIGFLGPTFVAEQPMMGSRPRPVGLEPLLEVPLSSLKLAVHQHGRSAASLTVDFTTAASVQYLDSSTLTMSTLLEPVVIDACYEASILDGGPIALDQEGAPRGWWWDGTDPADLDKLAMRAPPLFSGTLLRIEAREHPLSVNLFELTPYEMQRLTHLLTHATTPAAPPIRLTNSSPASVLVRQTGTMKNISLPPGASIGYYWTEPPVSCQGAQGSLQLALCESHAGLGEVAWSEPLEVRKGHCISRGVLSAKRLNI